MPENHHPPQIKVQRVQTGVRVEQRLLKVLKALAELFDISLGDLLEGIVLHALEGQSPFHGETLQRIETLKQVYNMDYGASASHHLVEEEQPPADHAPADRRKQVAVVSLWAEDVPTAVHFYRDVVGLDLVPDHAKHPAFALADGAYLVIIQGKPVPAQDSAAPDWPLIAFAVGDLDQAIERLRAHGVALPWGAGTGHAPRWVKFRDPAGNVIEFVQASIAA
jgi:catechol 2,3-dioxygenase-like lactoylglutathione lyase family enzyme